MKQSHGHIPRTVNRLNNQIERLAKDPRPRLAYWKSYTLVFLLCAATAFLSHIILQKNFIWVGEHGNLDGMSQHYPALVYWGRYLRSAVSSLFSGTGSLPMYDNSIGLGGDVFLTLSYYVTGDPLNLLSIFVPAQYTEYLYGFLILLRLYLAGLAFSVLAWHFTGGKNRFYILVGAMVYTFSAYSLVAAVRHPYFVNPLIYFPLVILGAEYIFQGKKPWVFILCVALAGISNFYFFYMICILTVIYVTVRVFHYVPKGERKRIFRYGWRFALNAALGVLMAGVLLYPSIQTTLHSSRVSSASSVSVLYSLRYYLLYPKAFFSIYGAGSWNYQGHLPLAAVAVFLMWAAPGKNRTQIIFFCISTVILCVPIFGYILNGMAYMSNRWIWAYSLLIGMICVMQLPKLASVNEKTRKILKRCLIFSAILMAVSVAIPTATLILAMLWLFVYAIPKTKKPSAYTRAAILFLVAVQILEFGLSRYLFNPYGKEFGNLGTAYDYTQNAPSASLPLPKDNEYYRYETYATDNASTFRNNALVTGGNSTDSYFSLASESWYGLLRSLGDKNFLMQKSEGLDNRTILGALSNVKYFTCKAEESGVVPYGYSSGPVLTSALKNQAQFRTAKGLTPGVENYVHYENENALPFGYTYDSFITRQEYDALSYADRQKALLYTAVLDAELPGLTKATPEQTQPLQIKVSFDDSVTQVGNTYYGQKGSQIYIDLLDAKGGCETYLNMKALDFHVPSPYAYGKAQGSWNTLSAIEQISDSVYEGLKTPVSIVYPVLSMGTAHKGIEIYSPDCAYYMGALDFCINMGYREEAPTRITLTMDTVSAYTIEGFEAYQIDLTGYEEQIANLSAEHLENVSFGRNHITGDITVSQDKLLCISLPYSEGWTAYVDGKPADIIQTDIAFMGIPLTEGTHSVELRYFTPYLSFGLLLSAVGWTVFLLWYTADAVTTRKKQKMRQGVC